MKKERVLITVKTYPTLSSTYGELVCTAGVRELTGEWIRIYPIPYRRLHEEYQFSKYQWINIQLMKSTKDTRSESYRPVNLHEIELMEKIPAGNSGWRARKKFVLIPENMYSSLNQLIMNTKSTNRSIAVFKPSKFIRFSVEHVDRDWDKKKLELCRALLMQQSLFDDHMHEIEPAQKIPYKFKITFSDEDGKESTMMVEDWEICELYRKCIRSSDSEEEAVDKVRKKCESLMFERDLYLVLGTTKAWHSIAPNPYIIIGLFYPPVDNQLSLGL